MEYSQEDDRDKPPDFYKEKKGKDNMRDKKRILKLAGIVALSAALAFAPLKPVQAQEVLPSVTVDSVTWDGGMLEVPVDLGSYTDEENLSVNIIIPDDIPHGDGSMKHLWGDIEGNKVIFSLWDTFDTNDNEYFFSKAGTYEMPIYFNVPDEEAGAGYTKVVSSDSFKLVIPVDSQQWKTPRSTVKFDGSEDIVFHFENGTNFWKLEKVSGIYVFLAMGIGFDLYDGYFFDAESGEMRIDKDVFVNALKDYSGDNGILYSEALINVHGVTTYGAEIYNFDRIDYVGDDPYYKTTVAWTVDLSELDLSGASQENETSEFAGTSSEEISVSEATGAQIAESALDYVKANYSAELAALDSYTVSSKIELSEADEKELDQAVKNAFAPYLTEWKAGKYYKIQVAASVLKDGQPVEGLENIIIPSLSEDVQVMLKVPGNLQQDSRNYKMLHYQNGTAEMLDCEENEGIITFKTDSFSPFALVYRDAVENSGSTDGTGVNNMGAADNTVNPKTGDHEGMACVASLFVGSLSILALTVARKRSRL